MKTTTNILEPASAFDRRWDAARTSGERYSEENHDEIQALVGHLITVDPEMGHDVRTVVAREPREFGVGYRVQWLVIGPNAWVADVLVFRDVLREVWRHNVLVDKLHALLKQAETRGPADLVRGLEKIGKQTASASILDGDGSVNLGLAVASIATLKEYESWARADLGLD